MTVRAAYGIYTDYPHFYEYGGYSDQPPWGYEVTLDSPAPLMIRAGLSRRKSIPGFSERRHPISAFRDLRHDPARPQNAVHQSMEPQPPETG